MGFEPTVELPLQRFSRPSPSTAQPPLRREPPLPKLNYNIFILYIGIAWPKKSKERSWFCRTFRAFVFFFIRVIGRGAGVAVFLGFGARYQAGLVF